GRRRRRGVAAAQPPARAARRVRLAAWLDPRRRPGRLAGTVRALVRRGAVRRDGDPGARRPTARGRAVVGPLLGRERADLHPVRAVRRAVELRRVPGRGRARRYPPGWAARRRPARRPTRCRTAAPRRGRPARTGRPVAPPRAWVAPLVGFQSGGLTLSGCSCAGAGRSPSVP